METDEWTDDDEAIVAQRARARNLLPQVTQQVKEALHETSIDLDVFLMIPATGDAIATFGTLADPPDELWTRIGRSSAQSYGARSGWLVFALGH